MDSLDRATQPRDLSGYIEKPDATVSNSNPPLPGYPQRRVPVSPGISQIANTRIASSQNQAEYAVKRLFTKPQALAPTGSTTITSTTTINGPSYLAATTPPPAVASLTAINKSTSIAIDSSVGLYMSQPDTATQFLFALLQAAPSVPYTFTAGLIFQTWDVPFMQAGICFSDGTKFSTLGYGSAGNILIETWNSATSFNGTSANTDPAHKLFIAPIVWFRLQDDGVNRKYFISTDGINFWQFFSESRTSFFTATRIGVFTDAQNSDGLPGIMTVVSWLVT